MVISPINMVDYYTHRFRVILRNLSNNSIFDQMFGIVMAYDQGRYRLIFNRELHSEYRYRLHVCLDFSIPMTPLAHLTEMDDFESILLFPT